MTILLKLLAPVCLAIGVAIILLYASSCGTGGG